MSIEIDIPPGATEVRITLPNSGVTGAVYIAVPESGTGSFSVDLPTEDEDASWLLSGPDPLFDPTADHTISFNTSEPATSVLDYGLTASYTDQQTIATLTTIHEYTIIGLQPGTLYHYEVTVTDASLNSDSTGDLTFTTESS